MHNCGTCCRLLGHLGVVLQVHQPPIFFDRSKHCNSKIQSKSYSVSRYSASLADLSPLTKMRHLNCSLLRFLIYATCVCDDFITISFLNLDTLELGVEQRGLGLENVR